MNSYQTRTETSGPHQETSPLGQAIPWYDAQEKSTGQAIYAGDIQLPGMLFGRLLRSSRPHARVVNLDCSIALKLAGVKAVATAKDAPLIRFGNFNNLLRDRYLFARDKVRHVGEPIAAVAAIDEDVAAQALELIRVEYQELPAIFDTQEALRPEAPLIHEEIDSYQAVPGIIKYGNVCAFSRVKAGDLEGGFDQADLLFEDTFSTQGIHQGYIEPLASVADIDRSGRITLWTTTQSPFASHSLLCHVLGLPGHRLHVVPAKVGGSFGGKGKLEIDPSCILLAMKTGRPVRMVLTRAEEFLSTGPRHASIIKLKTGAKKDGTITARQAELIFDTGAYADFGPAVASEAAQQVRGPYRIPHYRLDAYAVYTNKPSAGCCRAHGAPQPTYAFESQMDIIATELNIDSLELRMKNALRLPDLDSLGRPLQVAHLPSFLTQASSWISNRRKSLAPNQGLGLALGTWHTGGRASSALLRINEDGTLTLSLGTVDVTGSNTVMTQIAAHELGLPLDAISISPVDTDHSPYDAGSSGSRVTHSLGQAVRRAAIAARTDLFALAAETLEANPDDLEAAASRIQVKGSPEKGISIAELTRISCHRKGGPILASSSYLPEVNKYNPEYVEGLVFASSNDLVHVVHVAEVDVDPETGSVTLTNLAAFHDIGFAINPLSVQGQAEGGAIQATGYALEEEILFRDGKPLNASFKDYRLPRAQEVPPVATFLIEDKAGPGPYGAKGLGELPAISVAPAIANAIYNASGVRVKNLPLTSEKIAKVLRQMRV